jgi:hypothetical protein
MRPSRRTVLKSVGAAGIGLASISGKVSGTDPRVMSLKGTVDNPITIREVRYLQNEFTEEIMGRSSGPESFGLIKDPTYDEKDLVGYGIRYDEQTKSPVEIIRTIPEPINIDELTSKPGIAQRSLGSGPPHDKEKIKQEIEKKVSQARSISMRELEERMHNQIDEFSRRNGKGV